MRSRQEIKAYAKHAFAAQRSSSILALLFVGLITFGAAMVISLPTMISSFRMMRDIFDNPYYYSYNYTEVSVLSSMTSLLSIPFTLFTLVLTVNISGFFVNVYYGQQTASSYPFTALKINFGRKLGGMCWELLWVYLWTLVGIFSLYIPTILKLLSYSQTQYILANNPNVQATDALRLSMRMMKGHRGKLFVMYLSFIGWQLLNALTLGILGILYVNPYMYTSFAGFFVEVRNAAVANGVIHPAELDGMQNQYYQDPQYQQYPPNAPPPPHYGQQYPQQQPMQYQQPQQQYPQQQYPQQQPVQYQQPQQFQPQPVQYQQPQQFQPQQQYQQPAPPPPPAYSQQPVAPPQQPTMPIQPEIPQMPEILNTPEPPAPPEPPANQDKTEIL